MKYIFICGRIEEYAGTNRPPGERVRLRSSLNTIVNHDRCVFEDESRIRGLRVNNVDFSSLLLNIDERKGRTNRVGACNCNEMSRKRGEATGNTD